MCRQAINQQALKHHTDFILEGTYYFYPPEIRCIYPSLNYDNGVYCIVELVNGVKLFVDVHEVGKLMEW